MKNNPPNGVMIPILEMPTFPVEFNNASAYKEPENNTMPAMKLYPDHTKDCAGNLSNKIPTASNAKV